jgi:hypothetical protein
MARSDRIVTCLEAKMRPKLHAKVSSSSLYLPASAASWRRSSANSCAVGPGAADGPEEEARLVFMLE